MSSMVERVARAIYEKRNGAGCKPWSRLPRSHQEPYLVDAKACMGALMEGPTPSMIEAMEEMYMPFGEMRAAWDGAFIEALNEEGQG